MKKKEKTDLKSGGEDKLLKSLKGRSDPFFGEDHKSSFLDIVRTKIVELDVALGVGGIACGRIIEIYGKESTGKSALALWIAKQVQDQLGKIVVIEDMEHGFSVSQAKSLGLNTELYYKKTKQGIKINPTGKLILREPFTAEEAFDDIKDFIMDDRIGCIIVDSVAALTPEEELEGDSKKKTIGLQARLMSQELRKLTKWVDVNNKILIFVNQVRDKIGVMFGEKSGSSGGKALKYYSTIRIAISRTGKCTKEIKRILKMKQIVGIKQKAKIVKNKLAPPFTEAEFDLYFYEGYDLVDNAITAGIKYGIIEKIPGTRKVKYNGVEYKNKDALTEVWTDDMSKELTNLILKEVK